MSLRVRTACGAFLALSVIFTGCRARREAGMETRPVRVKAVRVAPAETGREFAYSGTITESETLPQSFSVTGTVTRVYVNEGDVVAKGALLAELDDASYRQVLEMAEATRKQAEDAFNRLARMYKNGNLPEVKYIEVETGLQKARAAAAIAKKSVDDCRLRANTAGTVGKRGIEPGMVAMPSLDSITIVRIDKVFARVPVPENDIALLHQGDRAAIRIGALGSREFAGKIETIGVLADPITHSYRIRIAVANRDRAIKPGMVCTAVVKGLERSSGLVIPNQAVLVDETGRHYVYCLDRSGNKAFVRNVTLGELLQNGIRITAGLSAGDAIVVYGQHKLVDGATVDVVEK
ncbi:MAG: efflux RND transporter periplasmic adaptor subunit [Acidobacteriota bacterium]|nr:efflux RND transporter periplasmic adaptor subunit [Acidobacteriota bacterium]